MNIYFASVQQTKQLLKNLQGWLDKADSFAQSKKFEADTLLTARLAPDQFPLGRQIMIVCDNAKGYSARLAGKSAPVHEDVEKTLPELRERIKKTLVFLDTLQPADFADAAARRITLPRVEGQYMDGAEYLISYALPNLYFHASTAYSILRHNGVDLGKSDYLGSLPWKPL